MDRHRLLMIFGGAWVSAALLTWFLYARTAAPKTEKTVKVVAAVRDLAPGEKLDKDKLKMITVAEKDVPRGAVLSPNEVIGRPVIYPVGAGEPISLSRVAGAGGEGIASTIQPGLRAMSVPFNDATGVSGLIQPRARVDVLYTRTGNAVEAMTVTVLEDVEVLSIGTKTVVDSAALQGPGGAAKGTTVGSTNQNRTATLLLTPEQAQKLELAKNQGKISLSLRNPMDRSHRTDPAATLMEEIDPLLIARTNQGRRGLAGRGVRDPKAWGQLIGEDAKPVPKPVEKKEPPKPRAVVDVYRGDKHVQELFQ